MQFKIQNSKFKIFLAILFLSLSVFFVRDVSALQISPAKQAVVVKNGDVQIVPVTFINDDDKTMVLTPEVSAFTTHPETGSPVFDVFDEAKSWIRVVPQRLQLLPGQEGIFSFTVSVPESAEERSHYLGLFAKSAPAAGQVGVGSRLGSLLFLHVGFSAHEELAPLHFGSDTRFTSGSDIFLSLILENTGSIHVIPSGSINSVGNELAKINIDKQKVLPGAKIQETYQVKDISKLKIGKNNIHATVLYGLTGQELRTQASVWYVPLTLILSGLGGVLILLLLVFFIKRKRRS
ncbi:MAG: hypothetical protein ABII02_00500 [Candidatus Magasanikbacteria bacterium]